MPRRAENEFGAIVRKTPAQTNHDKGSSDLFFFERGECRWPNVGSMPKANHRDSRLILNLCANVSVSDGQGPDR